MKLDFSAQEIRRLRALLERCLDDLECDKNSYRIAVPTDPKFGRLVRDGKDITAGVYRAERDTRAFLQKIGGARA